jgi:hypothetical protein
MMTQAQFDAYLRQTAECFDAVEAIPHHPPLPRHYYMHPPLTGGDGEALRQLLGCFRPATPVDHDLLHAFFLSLFWGGPPGARPAWLFTAEANDPEGGRGVGKSRLAQLGARLVGGAVGVESHERMSEVITRLLSPDALDKRVLLLDNVKTLKFSWAELESLITTDVVSGHRMYHGEAQRPNTLSVCVTLNGAALSRDLAKRSVPVQLARPDYDAAWEDRVKEFIDARRWDIVGDCLAALQGPGRPLTEFTRWGAWEAGVLSHVADPLACQQAIRRRQDDVDEDAGEAAEVRAYIADALRQYRHDPERAVVSIPSAVAAEWVNAATGERRPTNKATAYLNQLHIPELRKRRTGRTRGWVWRGGAAAAAAEAVELHSGAPPGGGSR